MNALLNPVALDVLDADSHRNGAQHFEGTLTYGLPAFSNRLTMTPGIGLAQAGSNPIGQHLQALKTLSIRSQSAKYLMIPPAVPWILIISCCITAKRIRTFNHMRLSQGGDMCYS